MVIVIYLGSVHVVCEDQSECVEETNSVLFYIYLTFHSLKCALFYSKNGIY